MSNRPLLSNIIAGAMEWALILLPVAIYLLVLAMWVNRRKKPLAVSGRMNFVGLLLAMSGFLFIGPLSWLPHLYRASGGEGYWFAYGVYALLVTLAGWIMIRRQRNTLVIYNIDPNDLAGLLEEVLAGMDVPHTVTPGRIAFEEGNLVLDIDVSFLFNNVTLNWIYGGNLELRHRIERNLTKALDDVDAGANPSGTILTLAALVILIFALFATVLFILPI